MQASSSSPPPGHLPSGRAPTGASIVDDLWARGLIHDNTDETQLRERLASGPTTLYCGFDPTADSLHLGNLFPLLMLRRFQDAGHRPIALAGGATGMIGDPSGRSEERNLLDSETLDRNLAAVSAQLERFLDFGPGPNQARLVDNREWTAPMSVLEFLRDVGKHLTVNVMLAKESVRARVESDSGISYTEFSYMLLQANDFRWLHENMDCELQVGGSDQWGNITAGIDLVRRTTGAHVHGLTLPLLVKADGSKYGKTAEGAIWLDPARTSPYALYQYLIRSADDDVERLLFHLTLVPVSRLQEVLEAHRRQPEQRQAQRLLAREVTTLAHGPDEMRAAEAATAVLFGTPGEPGLPAIELDERAYGVLAAEIPNAEMGEAAGGLVDLLVSGGLARSRSDARRALEAGEIALNGHPEPEDRLLEESDLRHGRFALLQRGRKRHSLVVR